MQAENSAVTYNPYSATPHSTTSFSPLEKNEYYGLGNFLFEQWYNSKSAFNRNIVTKGVVAATNTIGGFLDFFIHTTKKIPEINNALKVRIHETKIAEIKLITKAICSQEEVEDLIYTAETDSLEINATTTNNPTPTCLAGATEQSPTESSFGVCSNNCVK